MRKFLFAAVALLPILTGCAEWQSVAKATHAQATQVAQNVNDDALTVSIQAICAQPYSSLQRNQGTTKGLVTALPALCGPLVPDPTIVTPELKAQIVAALGAPR
jgi:hypothetical protein